MSDEIPFDPDYQAYIVEFEDGSKRFLFSSRYYASKWIKDHVPEIGQEMWKVFEMDGYYRVFRFLEYEF